MFTLYQRWGAEQQLSPENFQYILTPKRALEEAAKYYELNRKNYQTCSAHGIPRRLNRPGLPYQRLPHFYADEIYDHLKQELEFGWIIGVMRFSLWDRVDNPFYFDNDGELIFDSFGNTHPWFEEHVRRIYENVLNNHQGGKPCATVKNHYGVSTGTTLNSTAVGRLLAAGGVYNGNIEGFRQTAEQLGGEATKGYNQVLNEKTAGTAIAVASVLATISKGGTAGEIVQLEKLSKEAVLSKNNFGRYRPERSLPRDKFGNALPDVSVPHTQLGTKSGRKGNYTQAREWGYDETGNLSLKRDIDFTDHGRPGAHPNPHQHNYISNPTGGTPQHGPAVELEIP